MRLVMGSRSATSLLLVGAFSLSGCSYFLSSATGQMADDLSAAVLDQDDPAIVRDGAPAYLIALDGLIEGEAVDLVVPGEAEAIRRLEAFAGAGQQVPFVGTTGDLQDFNPKPEGFQPAGEQFYHRLVGLVPLGIDTAHRRCKHRGQC